MKTHHVVAAIMGLAIVFLLAGCTDTQDHLQDARAKIAAVLPTPYYEDLVTEAVDVDGNRLVLRIRSPVGDAVKTRKSEHFDSLKQSEQRALRDLCGMSEIAPLIDSDAVLVRRFIDRNDAVFFDVELPARECLTPPADTPVQP